MKAIYCVLILASWTILAVSARVDRRLGFLSRKRVDFSQPPMAWCLTTARNQTECEQTACKAQHCDHYKDMLCLQSGEQRCQDVAGRKKYCQETKMMECTSSSDAGPLHSCINQALEYCENFNYQDCTPQEYCDSAEWESQCFEIYETECESIDHLEPAKPWCIENYALDCLKAATKLCSLDAAGGTGDLSSMSTCITNSLRRCDSSAAEYCDSFACKSQQCNLRSTQEECWLRSEAQCNQGAVSPAEKSKYCSIVSAKACQDAKGSAGYQACIEGQDQRCQSRDRASFCLDVYADAYCQSDEQKSACFKRFESKCLSVDKAVTDCYTDSDCHDAAKPVCKLGSCVFYEAPSDTPATCTHSEAQSYIQGRADLCKQFDKSRCLTSSTCAWNKCTFIDAPSAVANQDFLVQNSSSPYYEMIPFANFKWAQTQPACTIEYSVDDEHLTVDAATGKIVVNEEYRHTHDDYTFKLKATTDDGTISETPSIKFSIPCVFLSAPKGVSKQTYIVDPLLPSLAPWARIEPAVALKNCPISYSTSNPKVRVGGTASFVELAEKADDGAYQSGSYTFTVAASLGNGDTTVSEEIQLDVPCAFVQGPKAANDTVFIADPTSLAPFVQFEPARALLGCEITYSVDDSSLVVHPHNSTVSVGSWFSNSTQAGSRGNYTFKITATTPNGATVVSEAVTLRVPCTILLSPIGKDVLLDVQPGTPLPSLPLERPATSLQGCPIKYQIDNPHLAIDEAGAVTPKNTSMEALVGDFEYKITASTLDGANQSTATITLRVPCGFIRGPSSNDLAQRWVIRAEDLESSKPTAQLVPALSQEGCDLKYSVSNSDLEPDQNGRFVKVKDSLKWKKATYQFTVTAEIVGSPEMKMTSESIELVLSCGIGSAAPKQNPNFVSNAKYQITANQTSISYFFEPFVTHTDCSVSNYQLVSATERSLATNSAIQFEPGCVLGPLCRTIVINSPKAQTQYSFRVLASAEGLDQAYSHIVTLEVTEGSESVSLSTPSSLIGNQQYLPGLDDTGFIVPPFKSDNSACPASQYSVLADNTTRYPAFIHDSVSGTQLSTMSRTVRAENGETNTLASSIYFELGDKSSSATYTFFIKAVACGSAEILAGPYSITVACDESVVVPNNTAVSSSYTFAVSSYGRLELVDWFTLSTNTKYCPITKYGVTSDASGPTYGATPVDGVEMNNTCNQTSTLQDKPCQQIQVKADKPTNYQFYLQAHVSPKAAYTSPKIDINIESQSLRYNNITWTNYQPPSNHSGYITYHTNGSSSQVYAWPSKPNGGNGSSAPNSPSDDQASLNYFSSPRSYIDNGKMYYSAYYSYVPTWGTAAQPMFNYDYMSYSEYAYERPSESRGESPSYNGAKKLTQNDIGWTTRCGDCIRAGSTACVAGSIFGTEYQKGQASPAERCCVDNLICEQYYKNAEYECSSQYLDGLYSYTICPMSGDQCGERDVYLYNHDNSTDPTAGASNTKKDGPVSRQLRDLKRGEVCTYRIFTQCGLPVFRPNFVDVPGGLIDNWNITYVEFEFEDVEQMASSNMPNYTTKFIYQIYSARQIAAMEAQGINMTKYVNTPRKGVYANSDADTDGKPASKGFNTVVQMQGELGRTFALLEETGDAVCKARAVFVTATALADNASMELQMAKHALRPTTWGANSGAQYLLMNLLLGMSLIGILSI